jgi:hypothetical protein
LRLKLAEGIEHGAEGIGLERRAFYHRLDNGAARVNTDIQIHFFSVLSVKSVVNFSFFSYSP